MTPTGQLFDYSLVVKMPMLDNRSKKKDQKVDVM